MEPSLALVIVLAIGLPLLGLAVLRDVVTRRREDALAETVPERHDPVVDALSPAYVTQRHVDAMPLPGAGRQSTGPAKGERFDFGHVSPDFATDGDVAQWRDPRFLLVADEITDMRSLLTPLTRRGDSPLVILATGFHADVVATLAANRRAVDLPVVACETTTVDLVEAHGIVGGDVLSAADLRSGYVPDPALGRSAGWTSDRRACWIEA